MQIPRAVPHLPILFASGVLCAFLSLGGCASDGDAEYGATYDPLTAFPATALWAWNESEIKLPTDKRLDTKSLDRRIRSVVGDGLAARGYTEATSGKIHYRVSYQVELHTWTSQTEARAFGSLAVSLVEATSRRKVWLGSLRLQIDQSLTPEERDTRLREGVAGMLEKFPPGQPDS